MVNLPGETKVSFNESLWLYCNNPWFNCKRLWRASHISGFRIRNGSLRIKLLNEFPSMMTHNCDLEKLFLRNPLIGDNYLLIDFSICCCDSNSSCFLILLRVSFYTFSFHVIFVNSTNESLVATYVGAFCFK